MKGIAFEIRALHCGIDETQIERRIVPHEHGARAPVRFHRFAHRVENCLERLALRHRESQRMIRIDTVELERRRLQVGAGKGLHMTGVGLGAMPAALAIDIQQHGGDLQKRVGLRVEATRLDVHDDRKKAAEARCHR